MSSFNYLLIDVEKKTCMTLTENINNFHNINCDSKKYTWLFTKETGGMCEQRLVQHIFHFLPLL
jgi:hypothetical protein